MLLGIEIGGTKLQLAVGAGDGTDFAAFERLSVDPSAGAAGIRRQFAAVGSRLIAQHAVTGIGIGFGGPIDAAAGRVTTSHQVEGWDGFPLVDWCREAFGRPAVLCNDCDAAALAEARFGAGRGRRTVFYMTVGTGVGGGLVIDGKLHGAGRPAVAEIGHLRPRVDSVDRHATVESIASGRGIEQALHRVLNESRTASADSAAVNELVARSGGDMTALTARSIAAAAAAGNPVAARVMQGAVRTLGWAVAQVVTLVAPEVVVVGGGVSLSDERVFLKPLRLEVARYVFPPLAGAYEIAPPALGEAVVVHGALALAADQLAATTS